DVVRGGTGAARYARAFVEEEQIPFLVLVDDDASAANAASVRKVNWFSLVGPATWSGTRRTWSDGYRIHKSGKRVNQLGASFVIGPGSILRNEHPDGGSTDTCLLYRIINSPLGSGCTC